jgi:flagellin
MALNSVNTNIGAMVALQSLNRTGDEMAVTQKRISTGLRVADAKDDGAAFAVAERIRTDISGLQTANEQLGSAQGFLKTTMESLNSASELTGKIEKVLVNLSNDGLSTTDRATYSKDFENLVNQMNRALGDASYNGKSLIGSQDANGGTSSAASTIGVVRNEAGSTLDITGVDGATLTFDNRVATRGKDVTGTFTQPESFAIDGGTISAAGARALLGNGDTASLPQVAAKTDTANFGGTAAAGAMKTFKTVQGAINTALAKFGSDSRAIDVATKFNTTKMDAMEAGLGSLVDADLAKESARLQALQTRQQLGTQALGIANQAPQSLLSLFR